MKPQKISFLLSLLLITAVSFTLPGVGGAAMWIGAQGGPNFVADGDVKASFGSADIARLKYVKTDPSFLGGVTIGYDFVKEGFLGRDWPNWMKYFSLALDLTYNNFSQPAQDVQAVIPSNPPRREFTIHIDRANGYILELSLLFIAKYGFLPTPELPFGRLIPYVGVGPGIVFSVVDTSSGAFFADNSSDSCEMAIFTEAGVRYMVWRNISLDAAFRYRYVFPSYDRNYDSTVGHFYGVGRIIAQSFGAIFRVNYHF
jgi:opacity protein-like surface antigen